MKNTNIKIIHFDLFFVLVFLYIFIQLQTHFSQIQKHVCGKNADLWSDNKIV